MEGILDFDMVTQNSSKLLKFNAAGSTRVAPVAPRIRFSFTKKLLDELPAPPKKRAYYYDERQPGLLLTAYPSGRKTFALYRKVAGRPDRITIGPYPDLTVEQARTRAAELKGAIARGQNPGRERARVRDEMTFGELFDAYIERYAKLHKKTWEKNSVPVFQCHLAHLGPRKISSITKTELTALHARIGKRAPYAANRVMELVRSAFNRAREWGWPGENPAQGIRPFKEHKRQRFLDADELPAFFQSLAEEENETVRDCILASLLTGARQSNVLEMSWPEIRWQRKVWEIPASKSKSGEPMSVVLSPPMLELLERRKASSTSSWVFPGRTMNRHLGEASKAWTLILKRAGIADCRLHDLRRTLGSWQAIEGASLVVIGKSLGHQSLASTAVYARLNMDPVRASVLRGTDAMLTAGKLPKGLLPASSLEKRDDDNG